MTNDARLGPASSNEARAQRIEAAIARHVDFAPAGDGWMGMTELPVAEELLRHQWECRDPPDNNVEKPYPSKEEYLAALYGILRVEGTEGLRFAVNRVRDDPGMMDDGAIAIYTDVRAKGYLMTKRGPFCRISFSTRRAGRKIRWQQSRRLLPGSVVAITTAVEPFKKGMKVAVVAQRPFEGGLELTPPEIDLLWADITDAAIDPEEDLLMVEHRNGFFESVRHTLVGLQHVGLSSIPSPLDKYIIAGDKTRIAPAYRREDPEIDFASLVDHAPTNGEKVQARSILRGVTSFPSSLLEQVSTLDKSQLEALRRIVHDELSIIQGPPGTGKTFTSVSALKVLLASRQPGSPPIIIAAQTNHALDQLLQHLHDAGVKIARLGGRTASPVMAERTMFHLRREGNVRYGRDYKALEARQEKLIQRAKDIVRAAVPNEGLLHPDELLRCGVITKTQHKSIAGNDDEWESAHGEKSLGPLQPWLASSIIPFALSVQVPDFDQYEEQADEEVEGELEIDVDEDVDMELGKTEDADHKIKGTWISIIPRFTGCLPERQKKRKIDAQAYLEQCDDLWDIPTDIRGVIYRYFLSRMAATMAVEFRRICDEFTDNAASFQKYKWAKDVEIIGHKELDISIVGCTTTGLTKYRGLIAALEPRTLLIEEAAETREANITAAIYPSLQQLILVGDHQQLTPQSDIRWLTEPPFNINCSMFERLVGLQLPYTILTNQRRMRPELCYIVQNFYHDLVNHPHVLEGNNRPDVPGMGGQNAWLFDHTWPEDQNNDTSRSNVAEAGMIVKFFAYLTQNGVPAKDITVLTYYNGQRKALLRLLRRDESIVRGDEEHPFKVSTVDSYQGEENEVILLSIVRSPAPDGRAAVGFLDNMNRAVVAISRARRGFYLFGNIDNVLDASQGSFELWGLIFNGFADQGLLNRDKGIPLHCAKHGQTTWVIKPEDFMGIAGGCRTKCDGKMIPCGHDCKLNCHSTPHDRLPCLEPCIKTLHCGHKCIKRCVDLCSCRCGNYKPPPPPVVRLPGNQRDQRQTSVDTNQSLAIRPKGHGQGQNQRCDRMTRCHNGGQNRNVRSDSSDASSVATSVGPSGLKTPGGTIADWNAFASNPSAHDAEINRSHQERSATARAEAARRGPIQLTHTFRNTTVSGDGKGTNKGNGLMTRTQHKVPPPRFPLGGGPGPSNVKTAPSGNQRVNMPKVPAPTMDGSAPTRAASQRAADIGFEAEVMGTFNRTQEIMVQNTPAHRLQHNTEYSGEHDEGDDQDNLIDL